MQKYYRICQTLEVTTDYEKEAHTTEIIRNILDVHNKEYSNLMGLRIAALCSLAFAGFLRYGDLCNIVAKHIEFHNDFIRIFSLRSKTDIYRPGREICLY